MNFLRYSLTPPPWLLPGVGTQSVVSEILSGKRQLNVRQIRWLADHFKVPVEMFI